MIIRVNKLRNLLRKWRAGLISQELVTEGFEEVLEVSISAAIDFSTYRDELRSLGWDKLKIYQKKNVEAAKAISTGTRKGFKRAIILISESKALRSELWEIIRIGRKHKSSLERLREIENLFDSIWKSRMPTLILLRHFLNQGLEKIKRHQFSQAKVFIDSCNRMFQESEKSYEELLIVQDSLISRISKIEIVCSETMKWISYCKDQPQIDLTHRNKNGLFRLLDQHKIRICELLLDDFEILLVQRIAFHNILMNQSNLSEKLVSRIKQSLQSDSWEGGGFAILVSEIRNQSIQFN